MLLNNPSSCNAVNISSTVAKSDNPTFFNAISKFFLASAEVKLKISGDIPIFCSVFITLFIDCGITAATPICPLVPYGFPASSTILPFLIRCALTFPSNLGTGCFPKVNPEVGVILCIKSVTPLNDLSPSIDAFTALRCEFKAVLCGCLVSEEFCSFNPGYLSFPLGPLAFSKPLTCLTLNSINFSNDPPERDLAKSKLLVAILIALFIGIPAEPVSSAASSIIILTLISSSYLGL